MIGDMNNKVMEKCFRLNRFVDLKNKNSKNPKSATVAELRNICSFINSTIDIGN